MTTSAGNKIGDNQNSLSAGARGPLLMQDYQLVEKLAHQISNEYSNAETNQHQLEVDELKSLQRFKELYN